MIQGAVATWNAVHHRPYPGPFTVTPDYPMLKQVSMSGDFEAVLSFGIGLDRVTGFRAYRPTGPDRLVIDVDIDVASRPVRGGVNGIDVDRDRVAAPLRRGRPRSIPLTAESLSAIRRGLATPAARPSWTMTTMNHSQRIRLLITGYRVSQAVHAAAVLGLSDLLASEPLSVVDLAATAGCDPRSLHRLLRALASVEVYRELDDGRFTSTPLGDQLRSDIDGNALGLAAFVGRPHTWQAWSALVHNVRTGENAFASVHGQTSWEFMAERPEESAIFDAAMTSNSDQAAASILRAYDFGRFDCVVDVGGGRGALLAAILGQHPSARGVLFDRPHVVTGAHARLEKAGVQDRCRIVGGDMFDEVPAGADAYVMKAILHDWEDPRARSILHACRRAMSDSATLLVVERLLDAANDTVAFADLNMMVGPGGLERTAAEYATLFAAAGFRLTRTVATTTDWVVIEAVPDRG